MLNIQPTGNYEDDCKLGRAAFERIMQDSPSPTKIAYHIQSMIEEGRISGLEVGFIHALSEFITY